MVCFVSGRASLHGLTSQRSSQRGRRVLRRSRPPPRAGTDLHGAAFDRGCGTDQHGGLVEVIFPLLRGLLLARGRPAVQSVITANSQNKDHIRM